MSQTESLQVWIADTEGGLCDQLPAALTAAGHRVRLLAPAENPFAAVREGGCDVLVLGIELPGRLGLERLRRFETGRLSRQLAVLVVSNRPELGYELPDAFDFLATPVDLSRLLDDVRHAGRNRSRDGREGHLADPERGLFQDFLARHSGLHFDQRNLKILERGLLRRMRALGSGDFRDYFSYLETFHEARQELKKLLALLTVGETYFFRYLAHFEALRHHALPDIVELNRSHRTLRLWSAGCSTGEEPYSLAIMLREHFPELADWEVRILATDINQMALNQARRGIYGQRALRVTDGELVEKYFRPHGKNYELAPSIRAMVDFRYLNLQTGSYPSAETATADIDLLFCRNVMIYFSQETSRTVVERFSRALRPGGFLFLGHAETLAYLNSSFQRVVQHRGFYYRLPADSPPRPPSAAVVATPSEPPAAPAPAPPASVPAEPGLVREEEGVPVAIEATALFRRGEEAFAREEFALADKLFVQTLARVPDHVGALTGRGFVCANRNDLAGALAFAQRALAVDDLSAAAYFLRGLVAELEQDWALAREEYRKALLIDLDLIMPHYHLSRVFSRLGRAADARRELSNTLRLLERLPGETLVHHSGGLTREVFLEICRAQLNQLPAG